MGERYRSAFTLASFALPATVVCPANQFTKLGEYQVKAGELITLGYGGISSMSDAIGRIYGVFKDAVPAEITGVLRMSIVSPQDRPQKIMEELRTEALNTVVGDRTKQTPWSMRIEDIGEDTKIVLEFKPDGAASKTITTANSSLVMDITQGVA